MLDASSLYALIIANGYLLLLILLIVEGPVVTYLGGLAASLGYLDFGLVVALAIIGSISADAAFFGIGRLGSKRVQRWAHRKQGRKNALADINQQVIEAPIKTLLYIKLMPFLSAPGFVLAGMSDVSFWRFLLYSSVIGAVYITAFAVLGWLSAIPLRAIDSYFGWAQLILFLIGALGGAWWVYHKRYNR